MANTYICDGCHKEFEEVEDWNPEKEANELWGEKNVAERYAQGDTSLVRICDDCFKAAFGDMNSVA